ncbi:NAD(P)H-binding protein [Litoribrevibacter albus]|uniref:NAD(P)-binding domain-containing protein n=1 Tax=Litoribrevibacter albus TaxID=1473156 RepID=A0AA37W4H3_9GAMM|nr:NAD(P)H-binding protein [Litoribrevibacter albus]GLQ30117.1 hypothetical protein GCM10007876_05950 [Litoribrevibacter albus]
MVEKSAVIFGATGLTGGHLFNELLASTHYQRVYAFTRRPLDVESDRLTVIEKPLEKVSSEDIKTLPEGVDVFICLGTTISKAGSKDAFKKIDYFLPMKLVNLLSSKAEHFLLISSLGADANAGSFYLSVKGQLEDDLKVLDINRLTIFRPSLLKGDRSEKRLMEGISLKLSALINPVFSLKLLHKYRPTDSKDLAKAMYKVATEQVGLSSARTNVISSDMITRLLNP